MDHQTDGRLLRKPKAIAKKAGVEGAALHRFRKTCADTRDEEGVSVSTIRIRPGHESPDVTLAYPKGKDAESEEAQEHANSSNPGALRIGSVQIKSARTGDLWRLMPGSPVFVFSPILCGLLVIRQHKRSRGKSASVLRGYKNAFHIMFGYGTSQFRKHTGSAGTPSRLRTPHMSVPASQLDLHTSGRVPFSASQLRVFR